MMDTMIFKDAQDFLKWYKNLNIDESVDMHEAMLIYFNLETYGVGV